MTDATPTGAHPLLRVRMFGSLDVAIGDHHLGPRDLGGAKPKQVLELLLIACGRPLAKDRIADSLWGDQLPVNVSATLETYVSVLRRRLRDHGAGREPIIITEHRAYRISRDLVLLDLDEFDQLVHRASTEPGKRRELLDRAVELATRPVLEDELYASWAGEIRASYATRLHGALVDLAEMALVDGDATAAQHHAGRVVAEDALNEQAWRALISAHDAAGDRARALQTFERCRRELLDQLGIEPTPETVELMTTIRGRAPARLDLDLDRRAVPHQLVAVPTRPLLTHAMTVTAATAASGAPGALPFTGRATELDRVVEAAQRALTGRFELVLVSGETGFGKSRFLDEVAARIIGFRVGRSRCSAFDTNVPYVGLALALRGVVSSDEFEQSILKLMASSASITPVEAFARPVCEQAPLALFLDDLHHADDATLATIDYLQRRCSEFPILVVATFQPSAVSTASPLRELRPSASVRLAPLDRAELRTLVPLGGLEPEATEPIPGLLSAMTTTPGTGMGAGADECAVDDVRSRYVHEWLRRMRPDARDVLRCSGNVDGWFTPAGLAALLGWPEPRVVGELRSLVVDGVLARCPGGFRVAWPEIADLFVRYAKVPQGLSS